MATSFNHHLYRTFSDHRDVFNFRFDRLTPPTRSRLLTLLALHGIGLAAVTRLAHWPLITVLALAVIALSGALTLEPGTGRRILQPELLLPLAILYLLAGVRVSLSIIFKLQGLEGLPPEWGQALGYHKGVILCLIWGVALQIARHVPRAYLPQIAAVALGGGIAGWVLVLYPRLLPAGVTGSDAFSYVQMGADLYHNGTVLHHFPLAGIPADLGIAIEPAAQVGYNLDYLTADRRAPTVWPPGYAVLLAGAAFLGGGMDAMLAVNGVLALINLAAAGWLTMVLLSRRPLSHRWRRGDTVQTPEHIPTEQNVAGEGAAALLAAAFLLTSTEQMIRQWVTWADIAAQLFTTLALLLALAGSGERVRRQTVWVIGAGLCYGLAYTTRYTQMLLFPAFIYLFWRQKKQGLLFFAAAGLIALPDLLYHAAIHGSPFNPGSNEWQHFALSNFFPVLLRVGGEWLRDWHLLTPLIIVGGWTLARSNRRAALACMLGLGSVLLFQLFYGYLRLRDLLFLWPLLAALAALGIWQLRRWPGAAFLLTLIILGVRWEAQQALSNGQHYFHGLLTADLRENIETLGDLTPPDAVIAASLNSGAVELYTGRQTLRPGRLLQPDHAWTTGEWLLVVAVLEEQNRPLYILADGEEMKEPLAAVRGEYTVTRIDTLTLPYYYAGGGAKLQPVGLYRVEWPGE